MTSPTTQAEQLAHKLRKIEQAKQYVEMRLREFGGPNPGQSAILVLNVRPADDDPESGFVMCGCLPDMDHKAIIAGLESWIADLKAGSLQQVPHGLDEGPQADETVQ